jgi:hypothetical protein
VADRGARQQLERGVVVDLVAADDAAVPMRRVLAEADVGREDEVGEAQAQLAERALDDPILVVGAGGLVVFLLGDAEEQHRRDAESRERLDLLDERVDGALRDPGQALEGMDDAVARADEERHHEVGQVEPRLADERAQPPGAP